MKVNLTTKEGLYTSVILTNDHFAAKPSKLLKLHHPGTRKNTKIPLIGKNITDFAKKFDHPGRIFVKKTLFFNIFLLNFWIVTRPYLRDFENLKVLKKTPLFGKYPTISL